MSVLSIQTRRIDGLTEATTAEDEDLLLIRKADGTGTRNIKKKNLVPETGVGNIKELETKDKTSVVKAVNELSEAIGDINRFGYGNYDGKKNLVNITSRELYNQQKSLANVSAKLADLEINIKKITGNGAGFHNSIYGGHWLREGLTDERLQAIRDGDFGDMFVGDVIGDSNFIIADFDYFYGRFSSYSDVYSRHHIVLIPLSAKGNTFQYGLYGSQKCYTDSPIRSQGEKNYDIQSVLKNAKLYDQYCPMEGSISKGAESNRYGISSSIFKSHVECMSAEMVFGYVPECGPNYHTWPSSGTQFAVFRLAPEYINANGGYWLTNTRDPNNSYYVDSNGTLGCYNRNNYLYLRPYFVIG